MLQSWGDVSSETLVLQNLLGDVSSDRLIPGKGIGPGFSFSVVNLSPVPCGKRAGGIIC